MSRASFLRPLINGAAVATLIKVGGIGVSFLFLIVMARTMTSEHFGVFASGLSLALILGPAVTFGQHTSVLRFWPAIDECYGRSMALHVIRRAFVITASGSIIVLLMGLLLSFVDIGQSAIGPEAFDWIFIAFLTCAIAFSELILNSLRSREKILWALFPRDVLWRGIVLMLVLVFSLELTSSAAFILVSSTLLALIFVQFLRLWVAEPDILQNKIEPKLPAKEEEVIGYSKWGFWVDSIVSRLEQHVSVIVVGLLLGPAFAGGFFIALKLAGLLNIFLIAANQISSPKIARFLGSENIAQAQVITSVTTVFATVPSMVALCVFVFAGPKLLSLFDQSYTTMYSALLILCASQVVNAACGPNTAVLMMSGQERIVPLLRLPAVVFQIVFLVILTPLFGPIGSALSLLISGVIWNAMLTYRCITKSSINPTIFGLMFVWKNDR